MSSNKKPTAQAQSEQEQNTQPADIQTEQRFLVSLDSADKLMSMVSKLPWEVANPIILLVKEAFIPVNVPKQDLPPANHS